MHIHLHVRLTPWLRAPAGTESPAPGTRRQSFVEAVSAKGLDNPVSRSGTADLQRG